MALPSTWISERRCKHRMRDGSQCRVPVAFPDGMCIFHSQSEAAINKRAEGRFKGGSKPERAPVQYNKDVPFLASSRSLIRFVNKQLKKALTGELSAEQFQVSLAGVAALSKLFEQDFLRDELEKLENSLEVLQQKIAVEKPAIADEVEDHEPRED